MTKKRTAAAPPSAATDEDPQRKALTAAMDRLLQGTPLHVPAGSSLTVTTLAAEANVNRSTATTRHRDLTDLFLARVKALSAQGKAEREVELEAALVEMRKSLRDQRERATAWENAFNDAARALKAVTRERDNLAERLEAVSAATNQSTPGNVRPIR